MQQFSVAAVAGPIRGKADMGGRKDIHNRRKDVDNRRTIRLRALVRQLRRAHAGVAGARLGALAYGEWRPGEEGTPAPPHAISRRGHFLKPVTLRSSFVTGFCNAIPAQSAAAEQPRLWPRCRTPMRSTAVWQALRRRHGLANPAAPGQDARHGPNRTRAHCRDRQRHRKAHGAAHGADAAHPRSEPVEAVGDGAQHYDEADQHNAE